MDEKENYIDIYTLIGKFVVEFEQICHTIESGIRCILLKEGLANDKIHEIILADLTAEPLYSLLRSLCHEHLKPNGENREIIDYIFKEFQALISIRNDIVHGKWFIVVKGLEGKQKPIALGQKLHKKKTGSATKKFEYDINAFKGYIEQVDLSLWNMSKLRNCIDGCFLLEKNFRKIGKGKFEAIKGLCIK